MGAFIVRAHSNMQPDGLWRRQWFDTLRLFSDVKNISHPLAMLALLGRPFRRPTAEPV
jgi:hypothetical protein